MTDHIYGRTNIVSNEQRPHVFVAELKLYLDYLQEQLVKGNGDALNPKRKSYYQSFLQNLTNAIEYYQNLALLFRSNQEQFRQSLQNAQKEIQAIKFKYALD